MPRRLPLLAALLVLAPSRLADAAILIEARKQHESLRVVVDGERAGKPVRHEFEVVDRFDASRGITAMMRTTGYSLSITGQLQAEGGIAAAGVHTPDECVPGDVYVAELAKRGIDVKQDSGVTTQVSGT